MRIFKKRKPNVKALASKGDVDGLIKAAGHAELVRGPDGRTVEVGAPIREEALFALFYVAPDRAGDLWSRRSAICQTGLEPRPSWRCMNWVSRNDSRKRW